MDTRHDDASERSGAHRLPRRAALRLLGAGGLAAGFVARGRGGTAAQDDAPEVVRDWIDAWNDNDPDAIAALYANDGIYEDVPSGQEARGDDISGFLADFFAVAGDVELELTDAFGDDDWAVAEYAFSATNQGIFPGAPVGASWSVRTVTVFELDGDEIRRSSDYYDVATILGQLGLLPAAGATPVPAGGAEPTPALATPVA